MGPGLRPGAAADGGQRSVSWCGRGLESPQLMRKSLGGPARPLQFIGEALCRA
jgi:hypothetical protein